MEQVIAQTKREKLLKQAEAQSRELEALERLLEESKRPVTAKQ